jgi:aryl-alcohol dehydrogenase-like predicted oxidoreductase
MEYRLLGKSDLEISRISLGCMSLNPNEESESVQIIHKAIDLGINFFDTADVYFKGQNEEMLGKAVKDHRKEIFIATKVGNVLKPDGSGFDWNPSKSHILQSVDESLRRLQTDYIDLYQLHGGTIDDPIDETIEAFELLKTQGKIRYYGISSIRPNVIREYVAKSGIVSVMMQYSLLDRRPEESVLELLSANGIGVLSRGALAQGLLTGKAPKAYLGHTPEGAAAAVKVVKTLSGNVGNQPETALGFVLKNNAVTSAVTGVSRLDQIKQIVTVSGKSLSDNEYKKLATTIPALTYTDHR